MQPSGVGGSELTRGLARFRSAPATWVEALLESEDEGDCPKPSLSPTQLPPTSSTRCPVPGYLSSREPGLFDSAGDAASGLGFLRQNSSPAEFLTQLGSGSESYFPNFAIPSTYDDYFVSPSIDISTKRARRVDSSQLVVQKGERDGNLKGVMGGFPDGDMDKLFEDTVPCKIRAKRGFATHPRSIAERVRRTRISDRIRKLQELVPNMDKQTNTADMLDEAVEYVKFLQKQIQELMEHQKNCRCLNTK